MMIDRMSFGIVLLALAGLSLPESAHAQNDEPEGAPKTKQAKAKAGDDAKAKAGDDAKAKAGDDAKAKAGDPGKTAQKASSEGRAAEGPRRPDPPAATKGKKPPSPKKSRAAKRVQRFIDRDGDGIHDGKEHRFRRGRGRRGLRFRDDAGRRLQQGRETQQRQRQGEGGEGGQQERQGGQGGGR